MDFKTSILAEATKPIFECLFQMFEVPIFSKEGKGMKCFKCGARCITEYIIKEQLHTCDPKIVAVQKVCTVCDWKSYPVKIPESIS